MYRIERVVALIHYALLMEGVISSDLYNSLAFVRETKRNYADSSFEATSTGGEGMRSLLRRWLTKRSIGPRNTGVGRT